VSGAVVTVVLLMFMSLLRGTRRELMFALQTFAVWLVCVASLFDNHQPSHGMDCQRNVENKFFVT